jgi:hypothetical protein
MNIKMAYIYKISCKDLNVKECYFGSTKDFKAREYKHKSNCYNENGKLYNTSVYKFIRENNGWGNWTMNIIDCITSIDKEIIKKCERKYIEENRDIVLNKDLPGRTDNEYRENNREKERERSKIYRDNNKEKVKQSKKDYYQKNKEKEILKQKIYREKNKDEINRKERERSKINRQKNKDEINRKARERRKNKKNDSK